MPRIMLKGNSSPTKTANILKQHFTTLKNCKLIDSFNRNYGALCMEVRVFERHFHRVSNRATLTLIVTGNEISTIVDAVATMPGEGGLIGFSWGIEEDFIYIIQEVLRKEGFYQPDNK